MRGFKIVSSANLCQFHRFSTTSRQSFFLKKFAEQVAASGPREHVVEMLKPIGQQDPPNENENTGIDSRGLVQKFKDFMDKDKSLKRQEELEKEISMSGLYDIHTFRKTKGKLFISPPTYFKAEKSLYFPNLCGETLTGPETKNTTPLLKGKVSIIRMFTSQTADTTSRSFFKLQFADYLTKEGYETFLKTYPNSQIIDINVTENLAKGIFVKMSKSGLRKLLGEPRYDRYFIVPKKSMTLSLRESIQFTNAYSGVVYAVDHEGKIRWASCGEASESERNTLWRVIRALEKERTALPTN